MIFDMKKTTIGILGLGHLGASLAFAALKNGIAAKNLYVSHRGSNASVQAAAKLGLTARVVRAEQLTASADIVVLAVRPQDALALAPFRAKPGTVVASCMAGLQTDFLSSAFGFGTRRIMCSGPGTIKMGIGTATLYPHDAAVCALLRRIGFDVFPSSSDEELDSFTVGICIPALIRALRIPRGDVAAAMEAMRRDYPIYGPLAGWLDKLPSDVEEPGNVATKGGVTETMLRRLADGASLESALRSGIARGRAIANEVASEAATAMKKAG
ncbi:NAD(P)-binding domain-containing protein [Synergistaceae bacterium OttesenSCG-928-I11]|nr:NAD(P)-binding domain-containing protein [Synergistaceae bacterium OttesenSCG-928-I11]